MKRSTQPVSQKQIQAYMIYQSLDLSLLHVLVLQLTTLHTAYKE